MNIILKCRKNIFKLQLYFLLGRSNTGTIPQNEKIFMLEI